MPRQIPESQRIRISRKREEVDAATTADAVLVADKGEYDARHLENGLGAANAV